MTMVYVAFKPQHSSLDIHRCEGLNLCSKIAAARISRIHLEIDRGGGEEKVGGDIIVGEVLTHPFEAHEGT
jgi:hypothetical protein